MTVRDLKLAIACGYESDEIKSLNTFFDELFSGLTIYTMDDKPDLIFMKDDKYIMSQDIKRGCLWCRRNMFWEVLENEFGCSLRETSEIIRYKIYDIFQNLSLIPLQLGNYNITILENNYKKRELKPIHQILFGESKYENHLKNNELIKIAENVIYLQ